jgi:hypothetical protein
MLIQLTGLTPSHHRFQIQRDDGSSEAVELETRSLLIHDLTHYAVEHESIVGPMQSHLTGQEAGAAGLAFHRNSRTRVSGRIRALVRYPRLPLGSHEVGQASCVVHCALFVFLDA